MRPSSFITNFTVTVLPTVGVGRLLQDDDPLPLNLHRIDHALEVGAIVAPPGVHRRCCRCWSCQTAVSARIAGRTWLGLHHLGARPRVGFGSIAGLHRGLAPWRIPGRPSRSLDFFRNRLRALSSRLAMTAADALLALAFDLSRCRREDSARGFRRGDLLLGLGRSIGRGRLAPGSTCSIGWSQAAAHNLIRFKVLFPLGSQGMSLLPSGVGFSCATCWFWAAKLFVLSGVFSGASGLVSTKLRTDPSGLGGNCTLVKVRARSQC